jgi:hypothetical protein
MTRADPETWLWLAACVIGSIGAFYYAFRSLRRARLIEDTPTARIRSAHQGEVELEGHAGLLPGEPIRAPLTGSECCWWRYKIERRGEKNNWRRVERGASDSIFILQDKTGSCLVDPEGAEVTPTDRSVWYGHSRHPENRRPDRSPVRGGFSWTWDSSYGGLFSASIGNGRYRYTEERIYPGNPLYLIGHFRSEDDIHHAAERKQITRDKLRTWKNDQADLLRRFDVDGDGRIDMQEWEQAQRQAAAEAAREHTERAASRIPHRVSRAPTRGQPFLISTLPQYDLVRRYRLFAGLSLGGFFVLGSVAVWLLGARIL